MVLRVEALSNGGRAIITDETTGHVRIYDHEKGLKPAEGANLSMFMQTYGLIGIEHMSVRETDLSELLKNFKQKRDKWVRDLLQNT